MDAPNVPPETSLSEPIERRAEHLVVGDAIAPKMLPWTRRATEVIFTDTYDLRGERRTFVAYRDEDGHRDSTNFRADALILLDRAADPSGLEFSRADDDPQIVRPHSPRVPLHTGGVVDGGQLVDETPAELVTRYFSFGHGQTDPDTGENLLDKYVTIVGPDVEACREAMFASRYGRAWAFDYAPDDEQWQEWGPRWSEHERIDAMPASTA